MSGSNPMLIDGQAGDVGRRSLSHVRAHSGLDQLIANIVRQRIVRLEYRPGTMLSENEVAREMSVSRTPVHQAFMRLAHEELLTVMPQRGALVSYLSRETVRHAQYIREALEAVAFADAARIWDPTNPVHRRCEAEVQMQLQAQRDAIARRDYFAFTEHDGAFHRAILSLVGNPILLETVGRMRNHLNRVRYLELQEASHEEELYADHVALLGLIRDNDVDGARSKLIAHLKMLEPIREQILDLHLDLFA